MECCGRTTSLVISMAWLAQTPDAQHWRCPICLDLLTDPAETSCCANLFCEGCLRGLTRCPLCKQPLQRWRINIPVQRLLENLAVPCHFTGCGVEVKRRDLPAHEAQCNWMPLPCKHGCRNIPRHTLPLHEQGCRLRPVTCKCSLTLPSCEVSTHLSALCPEVPQECPQTCGAIVKRGQMGFHQSEECPNSLVRCRNLSAAGIFCTVSCIRKEIPEHQLVCQFRRVPCPYGCVRKVIYADLMQHGEVCESRVLPCIQGCGASAKRKESEVHSRICPLQPVACPFACTAVLRRDLAAHLRAEECRHWVNTATRLSQLAYEMAKLQEEVTSLRCAQRVEVRALEAC